MMGWFAHLVLRNTKGLYIVTRLEDRYWLSIKDAAYGVCCGEGSVGSYVCCMYGGGWVATQDASTTSHALT